MSADPQQLVLAPPLRLPSRRPISLRGLSTAASLTLVVALAIFWALVLRPQSLGGPASYVLVSGRSMLPHYRTGDLVLVEPRASYHVGEVVAYRVPKGDPMAGLQVFHRIVGGDAEHGFVVQGDNRTAPDVWRPKPRDIVGEKVLRIPDAFAVLRVLRSPLLLGILAASLAFAYYLPRSRKAQRAAATPESPWTPPPGGIEDEQR
jgi:signal peptidase I